MSRRLFHQMLAYASRVPVLRQALAANYQIKHRRHPWMRRHPLDVLYGTTTNGTLPPWLLGSGLAAEAHVTAYAGCQPSCVRDALAAIPHPAERTFLDLGCGKGRALIVASELPFRRIVGVELGPGLVVAARRNAGIVRRKHRLRTAIEVINGDALAVALPEGDLVVFIYHAFGPELVARMLTRLEAEAAGRDIFLIYENPVHGNVVDASNVCARWHCRTVPCDPDEIGCAPDGRETVVVWRLGGSPWPSATTPIAITMAGWKAELATDLPIY